MTSLGWLLPIGAGASGLGPPAKHSRAACSGAEKEERPTSHRGKSWCAPAQEAGEGGKGFRSPEPQEVTCPQAQTTSVPPHSQMRQEWYLLLSPAYLRDLPVSGTEMAWRLYMACGVLGVFFLAISELEGGLHTLGQPGQSSGPTLALSSFSTSVIPPGSSLLPSLLPCLPRSLWPLLMTDCFWSLSPMPTASTTPLAPRRPSSPDLSVGLDHISTCLPYVTP